MGMPPRQADSNREAPAATPMEGPLEPTTKTSEARLRGRLRWLMPVEGATRANDKNERSEIEGEAPLAYASGGGDASPINRARAV